MSVFASILDLLASVLHSFRQHKARALLTLLGMIIGAGSVVLLSGLLAGGEDALSSTQQFVEEKDVIEIENSAAPEKQRRDGRLTGRRRADGLATQGPGR